MLHTQNTQYAVYANDVNAFHDTTNSFLSYISNVYMQTGMTRGNASSAAQSVLFSYVQRQVFMDSITATLVASTIFAMIAIPLTFLVKGKNKEDKS